MKMYLRVYLHQIYIYMSTNMYMCTYMYMNIYGSVPKHFVYKDNSLTLRTPFPFHKYETNSVS